MIPSQLVPSANHLWQSTLFAGVAGLLTVFLRKNRAHVRYWLWLIASVKFLLPFSILVVIGGLLGRHTTAAVAPSGLVSAADFSSFVEQVGEPFTVTVPQFALPAVQRSYTSVAVAVLIFVWAIGFVTLVCRWTLRWWRIRATVRNASLLDLPIGLPVKSSPAFGEPGVFGIFRPALLLPDKILDCLTVGEMESIVAHELCHVRRRDNLATVIHMAVEVVFWFHPLVWWLGARLMEERERACDEEVLRTGGDPRAYAEGILKICELYLASPLACVAGVTGGDLKRRIEAIVSGHEVLPISFAKKVGLSVAAAAALALPIGVGIGHPRTAQAQSQSPVRPSDAATLRFEVASVKTCAVEPNTGNERRPEYKITPGRADIECLTLERIIYFAYGGVGSLKNPLLNDHPLDPTHVRGGPGWIRSQKFTINGKAEGTADRTVLMGPMLRALLEERFQLKAHRQTEEIAMYAMTVAKGGLKIKPLQEGGCTSRDTIKGLSQDAVAAFDRGPTPICGSFSSMGDGVNANWVLGGQSLARFASSILSNLTDRYVMDKTGVTGIFNIRLEFALDESLRSGVFGGGRAVDPPPPGIERAPSLFTALEQQLGLRIEKTKGPHEFLVIDHVEKPSEN